MTGSISEFKSSFKTDLARSNRFDVNIPVPLVLLPYISNSRNLKYRCESTTIPGKSLSTVERVIGSSPIEKQPYQITFTDVDLTFMVSGDMSERVFFESWMEAINPSANYNFKYKSDYAVDITINQYDVSNDLVYSVTLREAFPVGINQMELDWNSEGYHKLTITLAYTEWYNNTSSAIGKKIISQGLSGLTEDLLKKVI